MLSLTDLYWKNGGIAHSVGFGIGVLIAIVISVILFTELWKTVRRMKQENVKLLSNSQELTVSQFKLKVKYWCYLLSGIWVSLLAIAFSVLLTLTIIYCSTANGLIH